MPQVSLPSRLNFQLLEAKLIWVQDRLLEKSLKTNAITVEDIPAWLVRRGRLVVLMGQERIEANSGNWVFPRQGQGWVHTLPNSKILSFRFRLRWPNGQEVYRRRRTLVLNSAKWPELTHAANTILGRLDGKTFWHADQWEPVSCTDYFSMQSHFYRWLAAYGRVMDAQGETRSIMNEAAVPALEARKALLDWDLARPFSRKILSRQLRLGIHTVSRRFAAHYGTTPRGFLEQRKLEWAQQRLAQSEERVKVIAAELGFLNLSQFSNWFRLRNQLSPREYRNLANGKAD
jgi:AraC-like DNA-binding protein